VPPEEGGRFAEVFDDATVALPLIVRAVLERIGYFKKKKRAKRSNGVPNRKS
jgi:deoxyhypusine synthase